MDRVYAWRNLESGFAKVKATPEGAGVGHQSVKAVEQQYLASLQTSLQEGRCRPQCVKRTWIPKPGSSEKRPLGVPTAQDRVAQTAYDITVMEQTRGTTKDENEGAEA